jgi:hypothetical protein
MSVFWNKDRILLVLVDYLEMGETTMAKYYVVFLDKLKQQLVCERQGKLSKGILILQGHAALQRADLPISGVYIYHIYIYIYIYIPVIFTSLLSAFVI